MLFNLTMFDGMDAEVRALRPFKAEVIEPTAAVQDFIVQPP